MDLGRYLASVLERRLAVWCLWTFLVSKAIISSQKHFYKSNYHTFMLFRPSTNRNRLRIYYSTPQLNRYASGATIQILIFGVLAISLKDVAPSAHTMCEIVRARWGKSAHMTFLFFGFCANIIVTSMLLLGGAATVEALTGVNYELASFLIPWGVILYTSAGGLKATFMASYLHTSIIFVVLV